MINEIKSDATTRMSKTIDALKDNLSKIRTGRAHTSLLDQITVSYYGNEVPLSQAATVSVLDARTLAVTPWEKAMVSPVEKAIMDSGLGLNPASTGNLIRIPLPPLTEERRKDLIKVVRSEAEAMRVAVRNIRRDVISDVRDLEKEKEISQDEERKAQDDIQKLTDKFIAEIDSILSVKEKELMEI